MRDVQELQMVSPRHHISYNATEQVHLHHQGERHNQQKSMPTKFKQEAALDNSAESHTLPQALP